MSRGNISTSGLLCIQILPESGKTLRSNGVNSIKIIYLFRLPKILVAYSATVVKTVFVIFFLKLL